MDYFESNFLFEAAPEDTPPDPDTGTNEPFTDTGDTSAPEQSAEDQPDPELAGDLTGTDNEDLQAQISELNTKIEELSKNLDLSNDIDIIKKRLDNITINSDPDLNDSIFQSASSEVKHIKRALRRISNKIVKKAGLSGEQQNAIILELEQNSNVSCQQIASNLSKKLNVSEQDIIDFIRNSDYRFRNKNRRESSVIDWDSLD